MNVAVETALIPLVEANPALVLLDAQKFSQFYEQMKRETDAHVPDVSTAKGRDAIKALAFKVTRTKTAIDAAGKKLNEEARSQINIVDASRREIRAQLEALADEVRKPLTKWEEDEEERLRKVTDMFVAFKALRAVYSHDTAATIGEQIERTAAKEIDPAIFLARTDEAIAERQSVVEHLKLAHVRLVKEEEDRAELVRLREEAAERERAAAAKVAAEAAERRAAEEAAASEARRVAAEQAERDRIAAAEKRAAESAKAEAERVHQAEIDRLNREAAQVEADRKARDQRLEREEQERRDEAKRVADEAARRQADQAHRAKIKGAAKAAMMTCGADEKTAKKIVMAIIAGEIPNVSLRF